MPYKTGSLKGQLTTAEIRKLVSAHNKLSKIKIPPKSTRDQILSIISKAGFRVNHEKELLEQVSMSDISLGKAKETTKRVPKTEEQKKQAKERKEKKEKEVKKREGELIKAGAIIGKARAKAQMKKEEEKPKPQPKKEKKVLAIEDKPKKTPKQRTDDILSKNGFTTLSEYLQTVDKIRRGLSDDKLTINIRRELAEYGNMIAKELNIVRPNISTNKEQIINDMTSLERQFMFLADKIRKKEVNLDDYKNKGLGKTFVLKDDTKKDVSKKDTKGFKVNRFDRAKMVNQISQDIGKKFDPYKTLGIKAKEETPELVKKRCRELRLKEHPDKGGDPQKFDLIQKACKILLDTQVIQKN